MDRRMHDLMEMLAEADTIFRNAKNLLAGLAKLVEVGAKLAEVAGLQGSKATAFTNLLKTAHADYLAHVRPYKTDPKGRPDPWIVALPADMGSAQDVDEALEDFVNALEDMERGLEDEYPEEPLDDRIVSARKALERARAMVK